MGDRNPEAGKGNIDPAAFATAITLSDTVNFEFTSRGIYVGVSGNIAAVVNGNAVVFKGAVAGSIIPIRATRINSTNTTATDLVALY